MRRTSAAPGACRPGRTPELGGARSRPEPAQRDVAWSRRLCACARFARCRDRTRRLSAGRGRDAWPSKIRATTRTVTTGRTGGMRTQPGWACRWCHGAPGIGLARAALLKRATLGCHRCCKDDIRHALAGVEQAWPTELDTLCCGTLGSVEFLCEAGEVLGRPDIRAGRRRTGSPPWCRPPRSAGDYRWNSGKRSFQSRALPRSCRRRLHAAAATRRHASQRPDLGMTRLRRLRYFMSVAQVA